MTPGERRLKQLEDSLEASLNSYQNGHPLLQESDYAVAAELRKSSKPFWCKLGFHSSKARVSWGLKSVYVEKVCMKCGGEWARSHGGMD